MGIAPALALRADVGRSTHPTCHAVPSCALSRCEGPVTDPTPRCHFPADSFAHSSHSREVRMKTLTRRLMTTALAVTLSSPILAPATMLADDHDGARRGGHDRLEH